MQNNIRNTNLRFNLDKEQQRRAWEYLQTMDRQDFKSYSQVISLALVDYFDRYYRTQADPYLETREREELFVKQIVDAVENSLKQVGVCCQKVRHVFTSNQKGLFSKKIPVYITIWL